VLLLVLVLEKSRYLSVTLMERNGARRFGPFFRRTIPTDRARARFLTSESGLKEGRAGSPSRPFLRSELLSREKKSACRPAGRLGDPPLPRVAHPHGRSTSLRRLQILAIGPICLAELEAVPIFVKPGQVAYIHAGLTRVSSRAPTMY
jgi:hypothetical protein